MHIQTPWFKNALIRWFIRTFDINLAELESSDPNDYRDFNQFFTRALKPGVRPLAEGTKSIVCPVDGCISQIGELDNQCILQAKGYQYDVVSLLGSEKLANHFYQGNFATLYLSPQNYHRVHMPLTGVLKEMIYIPGRIFSVNQKTVASLPNLFTRNERVITVFQTQMGEMVMVLVGAMLVASISTAWAGVVTPRKNCMTSWNYKDQKIKLERGEEMGRFQYGSTVIILFPHNQVIWKENLKTNDEMDMGDLLGTLKKESVL